MTEHQKIVDLYVQDKKSTYEIAELLNTYPNKIRRILLKSGVELKNKSEAQKNALQNGVSKIPTQGKKRTKTEKLKISSGLKDHWDNISQKDYDDFVKKAKIRWSELSEEEKSMMSSSAIKAIQAAGKEGSKLEKFLLQELTKAGHKIEFHKKGLIPNHNLEIDLYFPELRAIIEVDGPSHFLPIWGELKLQKQIKADQQKSGLILGKGFIIIRIKNMSDNVALASQEKLKNQLIDILHSIKANPPKKSERYIEIEI